MRGFSRQSVSRDLSRDLSTNDGFGPGDSPPPGEPFVPISFVSKGMSPATKQAIERIEKRLETSVAQSHAERGVALCACELIESRGRCVVFYFCFSFYIFNVCCTGRRTNFVDRFIIGYFKPQRDTKVSVSI